ncbi:UvrD-helicase domain-containing protein [Nostoc cycadae]|nr:UvrD-helicase domain-containing protein [Nostoc cycadae]
MPVKEASIANLKTQAPKWQHLPTKPVRVPEIFSEQVEQYARSLDRGESIPSFNDVFFSIHRFSENELYQLLLAIYAVYRPKDPKPLPITQYPVQAGLESPHWSGDTGRDEPPQLTPFETVIAALNNLDKDELQQIRLALDSLLSEVDHKSSDRQTQIQPQPEPKPAVQPPLLEQPKLTDAEIQAYTRKFGFVPSKYQLAIIDWILRGKGNACCNAVAGAGKSSSLFLVAKSLEEAGIQIHEVKICVFGKENSLDLIRKFGKRWEQSISTLHSAGWSLVKQELNIKNSREVRVTNNKYRDIAASFDLLPAPGKSKISLLTANKIVEKTDIFLKLIDLVRLYNLEPNSETLEKLCKHHEFEGLLNPYECAKQIKRCLMVGEQQAANKVAFDFVDQLWLPIKWELYQRSWFKPYKFVLVDECQDLNAIQLELVCALAGKHGRILAVGDPRQAIMGFAGANCDSYQAIYRRINAQELPLSICYRCPSIHIELVQEIFPNIPIEVASNAKLGSIEKITKDDVLEKIQNKDMVLSRKTAPLVNLCLKLISHKKKAQIKGRSIGDSLKAEMKAIQDDFYFMWSDFNKSLDSYFEKKKATYYGLDNEEQKIESLGDKIEAIRAIYEACPNAQSVDDLMLEIDAIFSDENAPITLSTCHRAKGLEAERIFIYKPNDMPMVWKKQQEWQYEQEMNLLYVALTRSKAELFIIGNCDWYKEKDNKDERSQQPEKV